MASDEIEKISQVQIVKDLVNHMNEFELYAAAKEKTMEIDHWKCSYKISFKGASKHS